MQTDATKVKVSSSNDAGLRRSQTFRITVPDESSFSMSAVVPIKHNFDAHPLLQLDQLELLAKRLMPTKQCRFIKPGATFASGFHHDEKPDDGRDIEEVFRRIEEPKSWIALYNVETDPLYAGLIEEALSSVRHLIDRQQPGMFRMNGFIFISAPPSVTPFHIDRENNFWLQVRGRKLMSVWDPKDRTMVSQPDIEKFIAFRSLENVKLGEGLKERGQELDCGPGDGVYFPSTSPHATTSDSSWVTPGDGVTISIGINFYTPVTRRHANVHAFNDLLRKAGLQPRYPGESDLIDRIKHPLGKAAMLVRKARGHQLPPGF
jgi:hypothetical protein